MYQIDNSSAAATQPASTTPGTPGFFTDGSVTGGIPATIVPAEWLNAVQEELINVLVAAGITPVKSTFTQLAAAIKAIVSTGWFLPWSSGFGAYPVGYIVQRLDGSGGWINVVANNTTNPDTGGAGWLPFGGSTNVLTQALSSGNVSFTALQAASPIIVLTGTLTANIQLTFPSWIGAEWTLINNTTGAFTVTCKQASGTTVVLPSTGATPIYSNSGGLVAALPSGLLLRTTLYNTAGSNTFVPHPLANSTKVRGCGGGGSGGGCAATSGTQAAAGQGGSSGSYCEAILPKLTSNQTVVVGAAGAAGAAGAHGNTGGTSSFGSFITLPGGNFGSLGAANTPPFVGTANIGSATPTFSGVTLVSLVSGGSIAPLAVGVSTTVVVPSQGATNIYGVSPSGGYGSGGQGNISGPSSAANAGAVGGNGFWLIEEFS